MSGFGEVPQVGADEETMKKAQELAGDLELAPLEGEREKKPEVVDLAQAAAVQAEHEKLRADAAEQAKQDEVAAGKILTQLGNDVPVDQGELRADKVEEDLEKLYGIDWKKMKFLWSTEGYSKNPLDQKDPDFDKKFKEFQAQRRSYEQSEVQLFDRVLAGTATEDEMNMAIVKAAERATKYDLSSRELPGCKPGGVS